ncbi:hypothetical protein BJX96DRAFT_80394 [Aspergillus floccosus]
MTSPDSQTEELDEKYLSIVSIQGRDYQKFSIDHRISFEPVDENVSSSNTKFSTGSLTTGLSFRLFLVSEESSTVAMVPDHGRWTLRSDTQTAR